MTEIVEQVTLDFSDSVAADADIDPDAADVAHASGPNVRCVRWLT